MALTYHQNGCVHFTVQPKGLQAESENPIKAEDFNMIELEGEALKVMTEPQRETERVARPSPSACGSPWPEA